MKVRKKGAEKKGDIRKIHFIWAQRYMNMFFHKMAFSLLFFGPVPCLLINASEGGIMILGLSIPGWSPFTHSVLASFFIASSFS